jgi:putative phosphoribosyl transferase
MSKRPTTPPQAVRFDDRRSAGRLLGERLAALADEHPVVLGLPRGGVPVAFEVAQALHAPLDVLLARKIGAPANPEYAIGALAEGDVRVLNGEAVASLMIGADELEAAAARTRTELERHARRYRGDRPAIDIEGRTVILVDDGIATGATARAALRAARIRRPRRLVLAVPVAAPETLQALSSEADEVVCLLEPDELWAVGLWYRDFAPVPDGEVIRMLYGHADDPPPPSPAQTREVRIPIAGILGDVTLPARPQGLVIFAHGSGSSRFSPRNRQVAQRLTERGLATLLLDLLQYGEESDRTNVFDVGLLSQRLVRATLWAQRQADLGSLPIGYFGASTGTAAALAAAAELPGRIAAVVSRGGRPDLAAHYLPAVTAPVLLIVGSRDDAVLELNREARELLQATSELAIVDGATHLFEEPGALEQVAQLAGDWFERHLAVAPAPSR